MRDKERKLAWLTVWVFASRRRFGMNVQRGIGGIHALTQAWNSRKTGCSCKILKKNLDGHCCALLGHVQIREQSCLIISTYFSPSVSTAVTNISWLLLLSELRVPVTTIEPRQGGGWGCWWAGGGTRDSSCEGRRKTMVWWIGKGRRHLLFKHFHDRYPAKYLRCPSSSVNRYRPQIPAISSRGWKPMRLPWSHGRGIYIVKGRFVDKICRKHHMEDSSTPSRNKGTIPRLLAKAIFGDLDTIRSTIGQGKN